jgi:ubiquinone/menaquinone biosynthesis C-methylase UbiE
MSEERFTGKEDIIKIAGAFKESRILLTAVELNIFTILDTHMLTINEIIIITGSDKKATERLLAALVGMGLIRKLKEKYYNTDASKTYLNKNSQKYLGRINHSNNLWDSWSTLTEAVKKGTSVIKDDINNRSQEWRNNFIQAMHNRGVHQAELLSYIIDFTDVNLMLDVGGGSGAFSFAFLNKNENMKAMIFDLPNILPITKKYIEKAKLSERIKTVAGDYHIDEFPQNLDLIFLSAVIHINSYEENAALISKCYSSLNPGGQIIILDYVMSDDRLAPYIGALFAVNMLVGTAKGDTYTKTEITEWFNKTGIHEVEFKSTSFGSTLIIGRK